MSGVKVNINLNKIVECKYDLVQDFSEGLAGVMVDDSDDDKWKYFDAPRNGKWGYVDTSGNEVITLEYYDAGCFADGHAVVGLRGNNYNSMFDNLERGCIDKKGNLVIQCKYLYFNNFYDSLCIAYNGKPGNNSGWGCLDVSSEVIVAFGKYDEMGLSWFSNDERDWYYGTKRFYEGMAIIRSGNKAGFVDNMGKEVISPVYDTAYHFLHNRAAVGVGKYKNRNWGFVDKTGNEIIPCKFEKVKSFSEGLAAVKQNGKWGFIDVKGNAIVPCKYKSVEYFSDGLSVVWDGKKYGFIDKLGNEIVPCKYDGVLGSLEFNKNWNGFSEGMSAVYLDGKWGFVDNAGNERIPCKYVGIGADIEKFSGGFAAIRPRPERKWGFLDKTGKEITGFIYDDVRYFSQGVAAVMCGDYKNRKWGFIEDSGEYVVPLVFDNAQSFCEGIARVQSGDKWGFIGLPPVKGFVTQGEK